MTPQQLVIAAQNGDRDAFAQLWQMYRPDVYRVVYYRTRNHHTAEDFTSETFLRAWKGIGSFTWQGKGFVGWVMTIARNITIDHFKSNQRQHEWLSEFGPEDQRQERDRDRRTDPAVVVEHHDLADALDAALVGLTDQQRTVIALRFGSGLRVAETAAATGMHPNAVKTCQHRAARALRQHPAITALEVAA